MSFWTGQNIHPSAIVKYSYEKVLVKGYFVKTVTWDKYHKIKVKIIDINGETVNIEYLHSKKLTWLKSYNLIKIVKSEGTGKHLFSFKIPSWFIYNRNIISTTTCT